MPSGLAVAANNGATARQLMAIFGWDTIRQAEHYTRKADQKQLAGAAMPPARKEVKSVNRSVPLFPRLVSHLLQAIERVSNFLMVVPRGGIEPPTPAFSVQCSTN
jgi:hypothetical protein